MIPSKKQSIQIANYKVYSTNGNITEYIHFATELENFFPNVAAGALW